MQKIYDGDWNEQAGISIGEWKAVCNDIEHLKKIEERYEYIKSFMKVGCVDLLENDALLQMKTLYFQFPGNSTEEQLSVDYAIDAVKLTGNYETQS